MLLFPSLLRQSTTTTRRGLSTLLPRHVLRDDGDGGGGGGGGQQEQLRCNNREANGSISRELLRLLRWAEGGGGEKAIKRHVERNGKILVRDRLTLLLDDKSDFHELSPLAGLHLYGKREDVPCGGIVTGIGRIHGVLCMVIANDATVKGGTIYPVGVKKQLRAQEIAMENRLPVVWLVDSGGAFLPLQDEIFPDKEHGGRAFYNEAVMSSRGISNIAVVCGSCTAGAAYVPCMADEAIIVKGIGSIFLGGPPLVKAATGEIVTVEELGGAEVHCGISGVTDHFANDEHEALEMARDAVLSLNSDLCTWTAQPFPEASTVEEPLYSADDFDALIPASDESDAGTSLPMRRVLARILDGSRLVEFKAKFGPSIVAGFAQIHGHPVGVVANDSPLICAQGARKAAHFVEICSQRRLPVVFFQNTTGFDPSSDALKESALLMRAVACASVPKLTVICGDSIGAANFAMCGRSQSPRFLYMWPNARISMAPELDEGAGTDGGDDAETAAVVEASNEMGRCMDAFYSSARIWDDGVIRPADTRKVLRQSLEAILHRGGPTPHEPLDIYDGHHANFGVFRL